MGTPNQLGGVGERIGRYHVVGKIAQGGMAEVLLAKLVGPQGFERPVVIKRILPQLAGDTKFIEMFLDEAKLISGIRHPNVVQVSELSEDGQYFLVMEYLAGESVSSLMKRLAVKRKRIPYSVCAHLVAEACGGLHAAHDLRGPDGQLRNVVHRDISPQNIFVTYDAVVKVIDFGIAKATDRMTKTEAGQLKGKFAYMAPESCRGGKIDRRTDIFSLATVLYEITTGVRLFRRSTDMKTLEAVCYEPIRRPSQVLKDYPKELEAIVMKGLERDPDKRYQTCSEMRRDLVRVAHALSQGGLPEEQLRNAMHSLFADRMQEKNEMLRRVRAGAVLEHVPEGEVESEVSIPVVVDERTGGVTGPSLTGVRPVNSQGVVDRVRFWFEQQERWKIGLMGGLVALVVLGFTSALVRSALRGDPAGAPVESPGGELAPPRPLASSGRPTDNVPPPSEVVIDLDTTPSGAEVRADGVFHGLTPVKITLPWSNGPVALEMKLPGYRTLLEPVVPNATQRLGFVLESDGTATPKVAAPRPESTKRSAPARKVSAPSKPAAPKKPAATAKPPSAGGGFEAFD